MDHRIERAIVRPPSANFADGLTTVDLGELTPSDGPAPTHDALAGALPGMTGAISQRPPAYSAIKVGGRRAYAMARAGETVTLASRDEMGFRMLLGRQAMRGRFLIDPGRSYMAGKPGKVPTVVAPEVVLAPAPISVARAGRRPV